MSYQDFQQRVYSYLIKYKKENLKIIDKGTSAHGVEHDCLLPKPYSEAKIPIMLYDGIKETVKDIQASKFAYKPHLAASVHVASSQTACINLFVPILESECLTLNQVDTIVNKDDSKQRFKTKVQEIILPSTGRFKD